MIFHHSEYQCMTVCEQCGRNYVHKLSFNKELFMAQFMLNFQFTRLKKRIAFEAQNPPNYKHPQAQVIKFRRLLSPNSKQKEGENYHRERGMEPE